MRRRRARWRRCRGAAPGRRSDAIKRRSHETGFSDHHGAAGGGQRSHLGDRRVAAGAASPHRDRGDWRGRGRGRRHRASATLARGRVRPLVFPGVPGGAGVALVHRRTVPHPVRIDDADVADRRLHPGQQVRLRDPVAGAGYQGHRDWQATTRGRGRVPLSAGPVDAIHQAGRRFARRSHRLLWQEALHQRGVGAAAAARRVCRHRIGKQHDRGGAPPGATR